MGKLHSKPGQCPRPRAGPLPPAALAPATANSLPLLSFRLPPPPPPRAMCLQPPCASAGRARKVGARWAPTGGTDWEAPRASAEWPNPRGSYYQGHPHPQLQPPVSQTRSWEETLCPQLCPSSLHQQACASSSDPQPLLLEYLNPALTAPPFQTPKPPLQDPCPFSFRPSALCPEILAPAPPAPPLLTLSSPHPLTPCSVRGFSDPHLSPPPFWPVSLALRSWGIASPWLSPLSLCSWDFAGPPSSDYPRPSLGLCSVLHTIPVPPPLPRPLFLPSLLSWVTFSLGGQTQGLPVVPAPGDSFAVSAAWARKGIEEWIGRQRCPGGSSGPRQLRAVGTVGRGTRV